MKDSDLAKLAHAEFWDERYAAEKKEAQDGEGEGEAAIGSFEWFRDFKKPRSFFEKHLPVDKGERISIWVVGIASFCFDLLEFVA